ncbi:bidirectional sugar transporter SWEET2-like isoform X2 [Olea europaea var. sylvestris]|uniref:Bidirectional sugar transporter SWEET n=1 Tax=Olea europaea subsp. europaea TaxID=158383 RepID=A0A8S0RS23_OLEEU|nr:bidirectional sugar transporter SWEET2-like isoform X2 [Olea europaea var. sylvestris]CAA2982777.1 bidirectional sugar transporter SWEET2 [Olea europaea subsp. europaea]
MVFLGSFQTLSICKDAAGIAGNISALVLFVSPVPTFRRIIRNESTEQFSGLPYIYALLNCIICAWYGSPLISSDNLSVTTVNSVGAVFQIVYIILFIIYAEKTEKVRVIGLLLAVLGIFAVIVIGSLLIIDLDVRHVAIGFLSSASLVSMLASPLFIINLVIKTRSVEFMPFYLSLSTFLMSTSFLLYGIFSFDPFIYAPNGIGTVLAIIQLVLFSYYKNASRDNSVVPLLVSHDMINGKTWAAVEEGRLSSS